MKKINYIIWHANRSGSNLLSNLLHKTGVAGIVDYEQCGFHIPQMYNDRLDQAQFKRLALEYHEMQRTTNGASGCKGGLPYVDLIKKHVNIHAALDWATSFYANIHLIRRDKVAQAVSALFAGTTSLFTSQSPPNNRPLPKYNYNILSYTIAELRGDDARTKSFLNEQGIRYLTVYYEDLIADMPGNVTRIIKYLGINDQYKIHPPDLQRQSHPLKDEYIQKYHTERNHKNGSRGTTYSTDSSE